MHSRISLTLALLLVVALATAALAPAQLANGNLQIHFMNVGQGNGALLVSPQGETVLFDNGVLFHCELPLNYLRGLGDLAEIDYHVASHYHSDHIGCSEEVFSEFPIQIAAYDRGHDYHTDTYDRYEDAVEGIRRTVIPGATLILDQGSENPVVIEFVAANGNGHPTRNENDRSVVAVVRFGDFDAVFGGDLSGEDTSRYRDVETHVAPLVGQVEVYNVNHHGSHHSTNGTWLDAVAPAIGIISSGVDNTHGHPRWDVIEDLHTAGTTLYWTTRGGGVDPEPGHDLVGDNIVVQVAPNAETFAVAWGGANPGTATHPMWESEPGEDTGPTYSWSTNSRYYHYSNCMYVGNIHDENLRTSDTAPNDRTLHRGCPR